jgi:hypothetical protein
VELDGNSRRPVTSSGTCAVKKERQRRTFFAAADDGLNESAGLSRVA